MTWPAKDQLVRGIDWSSWQQMPGSTVGNKIPIPVPEFCAHNPGVEVAILRAVWPSGHPDPLYKHYYDAFRAEGKTVIAYLWPNPLRSDILARWTEALLGTDPDALMLDFELTFYQTNQVLTDNAEQSFDDAALFNVPVIGYTRAYWWQQHIIRTIERGRDFIIAHYPYFLIDGVQRLVRTHEELERFLPIHNTFTPYLGDRFSLTDPNKGLVKGWQVSEKGRLAPYPSDMDLDSLFLSYVDSLRGELPPEPPLPPEDRTATIDVRGVESIILSTEAVTDVSIVQE